MHVEVDVEEKRANVRVFGVSAIRLQKLYRDRYDLLLDFVEICGLFLTTRLTLTHFYVQRIVSRKGIDARRFIFSSGLQDHHETLYSGFFLGGGGSLNANLEIPSKSSSKNIEQYFHLSLLGSVDVDFRCQSSRCRCLLHAKRSGMRIQFTRRIRNKEK